MGKSKAPETPLEDYMDPLKFYNHGDNPAMKNFMKIAMQNARQGKIIDHRTMMIDKGQKYLLTRNWDDFMQRDLQATTFPRAFAIFVCNTMFSLAAIRISRSLLPIGRFGIRKISETSLYHNFGVIGVAGAVSLFGVAVFSEYKTFKFTLHKFYRHVLMGERNWFMQESKRTSVFGTYGYSDNILGNEDGFTKTDAFKWATSKQQDWEPTYQGPYGQPTQK